MAKKYNMDMKFFRIIKPIKSGSINPVFKINICLKVDFLQVMEVNSLHNVNSVNSGHI